MKLAFSLFKYFPYGGLQRDFLRIARACRQRGHDIHVYTMAWEGELETDFTVHQLPVKGWQNHARITAFIGQVQAALAREKFDLVIGFNKMPHLDLYYAADVCYQARIHETKAALYRLLPRYRRYAAWEKAVFAQGGETEIMLISSQQQTEFARFYQTEPNRFHLLPPGIDKDRIPPLDAVHIRENTRNSLQISPDDVFLLALGSGFKTKGLDRSLLGLAALPPSLRERSHLYVVGQDNPAIFKKLAENLGILKQVHFLGGRQDVPNLLLSADILLHPAYHENTGTALLEALVAGLPVLTVDVCGYAHYIVEAKVGHVLASPFQQAEFNTTLQKMILSLNQMPWRQNGLSFGKMADIYSLPEKAVELIEQVGRTRVPSQ